MSKSNYQKTFNRAYTLVNMIKYYFCREYAKNYLSYKQFDVLYYNKLSEVKDYMNKVGRIRPRITSIKKLISNLNNAINQDNDENLYIPYKYIDALHCIQYIFIISLLDNDDDASIFRYAINDQLKAITNDMKKSTKKKYYKMLTYGINDDGDE